MAIAAAAQAIFASAIGTLNAVRRTRVSLVAVCAESLAESAGHGHRGPAHRHGDRGRGRTPHGVRRRRHRFGCADGTDAWSPPARTSCGRPSRPSALCRSDRRCGRRVCDVHAYRLGVARAARRSGCRRPVRRGRADRHALALSRTCRGDRLVAAVRGQGGGRRSCSPWPGARSPAAAAGRARHPGRALVRVGRARLAWAAATWPVAPSRWGCHRTCSCGVSHRC